MKYKSPHESENRAMTVPCFLGRVVLFRATRPGFIFIPDPNLGPDREPQIMRC